MDDKAESTKTWDQIKDSLQTQLLPRLSEDCLFWMNRSQTETYVAATKTFDILLTMSSILEDGETYFITWVDESGAFLEGSEIHKVIRARVSDLRYTKDIRRHKTAVWKSLQMVSSYFLEKRHELSYPYNFRQWCLRMRDFSTLKLGE